MILSHIVKGKYEVKDIPRGTDDNAESGMIMISVNGSKFRIYSFQEPYEETPEAGPVVLYIRGGKYMDTKIDVASTDIEPTNGDCTFFGLCVYFGTVLIIDRDKI